MTVKVKQYVAVMMVVLAACILTGGGIKPRGAADERPYLIMVYMNGSDLESDFGAATDDLLEMIDSGLLAQNAYVLVLTGGAYRWMNEVIPARECVIWELVDGHLYEVKSMGDVNMGDSYTLRNFIRFGLEHYPARRTGLIMWDHGGGSIAGFGLDENFCDGTLTLLDMDRAFYEAGLHENRLEFLGFDACLMATVEMAIVAAPYARVMIASEDLEPGDGWDYGFLGALNQNPNMDGFALGKVIVDHFMDFFPTDTDEILTLSVVDLEKVEPVMEAMGQLMTAGLDSLKGTLRGRGTRLGFSCLATRRSNTKTFGEGSPRDNYADMVDIGDMAKQLSDLFPTEAEAVLHALSQCVVYNRHNADVDLYGLSTFYIYGGKSIGRDSLKTYSALEMDADYTRYLHVFLDGLKGNYPVEVVRREWVLWEPLTADTYRMAGLADGAECNCIEKLWPHIYGNSVTLFPIASTKKGQQYAIPARVNGRDGDIIVVFSPCVPEGRIKGVRYSSEHVMQKGYDPINRGDQVMLYAPEWNSLTDTFTWKRGRPFLVRGNLHLSWDAAPDGFGVGERLTDAYNKVTYTTPAHQRRAFSNAIWNWGLAQTSAVWPGVSTQTRPLPWVRV